MMLRDVFTVTRGESVKVHAGTRELWEGKFIGVDGAYAVIDTRPGPTHVLLRDGAFDVLDKNGNCLGFMESEPDLRGAVPDLE